MIVISINVQKRLLKASTAFEKLMDCEKIDIALLQETDIRAHETPPVMKGYSSIAHRNKAGVARAIIYVKDSLKPTKIEWEEELPIVIIRLR